MEKKYIALFTCSFLALIGLFYFSQKTSLQETPQMLYQKRLDNVLPIYGNADSSDLKNIKYETIDTFSFINQDSTIFTNKNIEGKILVVNFFFATCQEVCPKMQDMVKNNTYQVFKDNPKLLFLSHTVDPEEDTPQNLKTYKENYLGIKDKNWQFLTGDKTALYKMCRASYFLAVDQASDSFIHSQEISLVDQQGRVRGLYNSHDQKAMEHLKKDIEILLSVSK